MNKDTIGLTSKTSAAARAYESDRINPLFIDPLARIYSSEESYSNDQIDEQKTSCFRRISLRKKITNRILSSKSLLNSRTGRLFGMNIEQIYEDIAVRTRFLDDIIEKNLSLNVKQIVLLACGGEYRPYRLSSSSFDFKYYLLDVPHVLKYRERCISQMLNPPIHSSNIIEVGCDLSNIQWSDLLRQTGFLIDCPTLWIAEGFFHYLTEEQITLLFNQIRQLSLSKETSIAFDLISTSFQSSTRRALSGGLFQFALDNQIDIERIFSQLNCYDIQCTSFEKLGQIYQRNISHDRSFIVQAKIYPLNISIN